MYKPRVVVIGSGFAGLEVAFRLRTDLGEAVRVDVVSDNAEFQFRANAIRLPFGPSGGQNLPLAAAMTERGIEHRIAGVTGLDLFGGFVHTDRAGRLGYDHLVIATGAGARPDDVPGLADYGRLITEPGDMRALGEDLRVVARRASRSRRERVLFAVPTGNLCPGPVYELAFLVDTWLRRQNVRDSVEIAFTTGEPRFLHQVNPMIHDLTGLEFDVKQIDATAGVELIKVNEREAVYADGTVRPFDIMVAFPPQAAAVEYAGLPCDSRGFIRCEAQTRAVVGHPEIHAPGDAGDHPVKMAYLATMQGTAAAVDISAALRATVRQRQLRLADDGQW